MMPASACCSAAPLSPQRRMRRQPCALRASFSTQLEGRCGYGEQEGCRTPRPPVVLDEHEVPDLQHIGVILVDKMCSIPTTNPVIVDLTAGTTWACVTHLPEVILHVAREDFGVIQPAYSGEDKSS